MLMIGLLHCDEGVPPAGVDEKPMQQFSEWIHTQSAIFEVM
jgi:hypothetical protein